MDQENKSQKKELVAATGRRKMAIARVRVNPAGEGKMIINGRPFLDYFKSIDHRIQVEKVLKFTETEGKVDVFVDVQGGGMGGQAGAISLGISRCLLSLNPDFRPGLRKEGFLTRDPRSKERKKYGRKGARRRFQWTKR